MVRPGLKVSLVLGGLLATALVGSCRHTEVDDDLGSDTASESDSNGDTETGSSSTDPETVWELSCLTTLDTGCDEWDHLPDNYMEMDSPIVWDVGLQFIAAGETSWVVLGQRTDESGTRPVVLIESGSYTDPIEIAGPDSYVAKGIVAPSDQTYGLAGFSKPYEVLGYPAIALLCDEAECRLYGVQTDVEGMAVGFAPVSGGLVPVDQAEGICGAGLDFHWGIYEHLGVCVAGDGVACFDGALWTMEVSPGEAMFNAIGAGFDGGESYSVAVGQAGNIWSNESGMWQPIGAESDIDFHTVSVGRKVFAAGGPGGYAYGNAEESITCNVPLGNVTAAFARTPDAEFPGGPREGLTIFMDDDTFAQVWAPDEGGEMKTCIGPSYLSGIPRSAWWNTGWADAVFSFALTDTGLFYRAEFSTFPE